MVAFISGAVLAAVAVLVVQATTSFRDAACDGRPGSVCPNPAFWSWATIKPGWIVVGACLGGLLAIGLQALGRRERRRRHEWGEL